MPLSSWPKMTALVFAHQPRMSLPGAGRSGLAAEALQDVVVGEPEIDLARLHHLLLEAAGEKRDAVVLEGLIARRGLWTALTPRRGHRDRPYAAKTCRQLWRWNRA